MKFPKRIFEKSYFFIFSWLCIGDLLALFKPDAEIFIYYHTLQAFYPPAGIFYFLAITRAIITVICLAPLFNYAFQKTTDLAQFFKPLLFIRVLLDLTGHNYEWQFLKILFHTAPLIPLAALSVWIGISFLSYKAHFLCIYKPQKLSKAE